MGLAAAPTDFCADLDRQSSAPDVLAWPNSVDTINAVAFNQVETSVLGELP